MQIWSVSVFVLRLYLQPKSFDLGGFDPARLIVVGLVVSGKRQRHCLIAIVMMPQPMSSNSMCVHTFPFCSFLKFIHYHHTSLALHQPVSLPFHSSTKELDQLLLVHLPHRILRQLPVDLQERPRQLVARQLALRLPARFGPPGMLSGPKKYFPSGFTAINIPWAPRTVHGGPNREEGASPSPRSPRCRPACRRYSHFHPPPIYTYLL
jgi:hypothetical protein